MHYEEIKSEFYWRYNVTLLVKEEGKKKGEVMIQISEFFTRKN